MIPGYALYPDGRRCDTTVFWKPLGGLPEGLKIVVLSSVRGYECLDSPDPEDSSLGSPSARV